MLANKILVVVSLLFTLKSYSQTLTTNQDTLLNKTIEQYVDSISPGIAVGIIQNGTIVYEKYIGYANLENAVKIDQNTRFNIASNAKQYTAMCILKLLEEGKLSLQDDIRNYLPDLYPTIENKITVAHLLTHTSGIRDVYDLWGLKGQTWWKLFIDNTDAVELIRSQEDLNFQPGTDYLYSNSNYLLLAEIVRKITNTDLDLFARSIFETFDMNNTSFLTNYMEIIPHRARAYGDWNGWKEYPAITEIYGDGGLFTSLTDQLKWEVILQNNSGHYLPQRLIEKSQATIPTSATKEYGYGLMFGNYKGQDYSYHDGNTGAYNATFLRFPNRNTSIVVLSNNGNVPTNYLAKQLADILLGLVEEQQTYSAEPEEIQKLEHLTDLIGNYETKDGTIIKIVERDGFLYREIYQRDPVKLIQETGGLFHYETIEKLKINFITENNTQQQFTIYLASQEPNVGIKLPTANLDEAYKSSLNGKFYNKETNTEISINFLKNDTYSLSKNGRERKAELIIRDFLRMNSYEIKIRRDHAGNVDGLVVKNGRIKNVIFSKK